MIRICKIRDVVRKGREGVSMGRDGPWCLDFAEVLKLVKMVGSKGL